MAIRTKKEFADKLKVGDVFWRLRDLFGTPIAIEGPCKITKFAVESKTLRVHYEVGNLKTDDSLAALMCEARGVHLDAQSAEEDLREKQKRFKNNPAKYLRDVQREDARIVNKDGINWVIFGEVTDKDLERLMKA